MQNTRPVVAGSVSNMNTQKHSHIAVAACSYQIDLVGDSNLIPIQLTPAGYFTAVDGRPASLPKAKCKQWFIDSAVASRVIARFGTLVNPIAVDYEHQTLYKEENGKPALAAAWFKSLEWREGKGLFATVELTANARAAIAAKEILFVSPIFRFNLESGEVQSIEMAAFTNTPAVHGMDALSLRAALCFGADNHIQEDSNMNKLHIATCTALALAATTTEDEAIAALNAKLSVDPLKEFKGALGLPDTADEKSLIAACTALKISGSSAAVDPAKYVPMAVVEDMRTEIAALSQRLSSRDTQDAQSIVDAALADGRILKPEEEHIRSWARTDIAACSAYLKSRAPLAALAGSQTQGKEPVPGNEHGLNAEEIAVCSRVGVSHESFKKAKAVQAQ